MKNDMKNIYLTLFVIFIVLFILNSCAKEEEELTTTSNSSNISEGSIDTPINLNISTPHSGSVDSWNYSYYRFTTNNPGNYKLTMSNVSIETGGTYYISAYIYEDSFFSNRISSDSCQSACVFDFDYENLDKNKTYYLRMYSWDDTYYKLTLSKGNSEGSINDPVELTIGQSKSSSVEGRGYYGKSFYKFTTSSTDNITITLNNSSSLDAILYSDNAFSNTFNYCDASSNLNCKITNTYNKSIEANKNYYLKIYFPSTIETSSSLNYSVTVNQ